MTFNLYHFGACLNWFQWPPVFSITVNLRWNYISLSILSTCEKTYKLLGNAFPCKLEQTSGDQDTSETNMSFDDHQERFKIRIASSIVKQWNFWIGNITWSPEHNGLWSTSEYRCALENNFNTLSKTRDRMM